MMRVLGYPAFYTRGGQRQPFTWLLYTHLQKLGVEVRPFSAKRVVAGSASVLHLHWPDRRVRASHPASALFRSGTLIALLDIARMRGMRIVWTVHNLSGHGGRSYPWLEPRYWAALTRRLDGFIAPSKAGMELARERFPALREKPGFLIPLGHLRGFYPEDLDRQAARQALGIPVDGRVIAFVGNVQPYKNVVRLVHVFHEIADSDLTLLIAGRPSPPALADEIRAAMGDDPRIRFFARFVPDEEIQRYVRAADLVALPFREILNSGSAILGLSLDRPVLVPCKGAMADLAARVGADWVRTYPGEFTRETLQAALNWATRAGRSERPDLEGMEWDHIARLTLDAYDSIGAPAPSRIAVNTRGSREGV